MDIRKFNETFKGMHARIKTATNDCKDNKAVTNLLIELENIDKRKDNSEAFLKTKIATVKSQFCNLLNNGVVKENGTSSTIKKIKMNLETLLAMCGKQSDANKGGLKNGDVEKSLSNLGISSEKNWYEVMGPEKVRNFHDKFAAIPKTDEARKRFEEYMSTLRGFLHANNLCHRLEYTGSVYEKVNICGDVLEFDVMFVVKTKDLIVATQKRTKKGYASLKQKEGCSIYTKYLDKNGYLDCNEYKKYFYGVVQRWLNTLDSPYFFKLQSHGVASLLNIFKNEADEKAWFQVDLVPSFELGDEIYVPKPPKEGPTNEWRRSYSLEEKNLFKTLDVVNGCKKHCVRITKALFKLHSNGLFKNFTSYCIKTVAFQLKDNNEVKWDEMHMGECIIIFLQKIIEHLKRQRLMHTFEGSINLLEGVNCGQMCKTLENKIKSEKSFLDWLKLESK